MDRRNVFISHIHEDDAGLGKLKDLLASKGMHIRDSSITSEKPNAAKDPDYIKHSILAPAMKFAGTFLVYVTPGTKDSKWVTWEIEHAAKQGMRIVGVWAHGDRDCDLPPALAEHADAMVGWNGDAIVDAIDGADVWERPDGGPCAEVPLKRHPC